MQTPSHKVVFEFGKGQSNRFCIVKEQWGEGSLKVISFGRSPQMQAFVRKARRVLTSWQYKCVETSGRVVYTSGC